MDDLTTRRRWTALAALAMGGFAVGLTEFVAMGLLPEIAAGLLPDEYARSTPDAIGHAGWTITAYALGVVVGAPTIAALSARVPRKKLVVGLLVLFVAGTGASALAPNFALVMVARFVAGLPHGAYFGAAGLLAARIMGPGNQAKGFSVVISGLTAANVVGVPLITVLGQTAGWRVAYLAIAAMFVLTNLIAAVAVFGLIADTHVGLFAGAFLIGGTSLFLGPALQAWLIQVAPGAQLMGAAINQSAMNIANSIGAALGGLVIARGFGYLAPAWVGVVLGVIGLVLAAAAFAAQRRAAPAPEEAVLASRS